MHLASNNLRNEISYISHLFGKSFSLKFYDSNLDFLSTKLENSNQFKSIDEKERNRSVFKSFKNRVVSPIGRIY